MAKRKSLMTVQKAVKKLKKNQSIPPPPQKAQKSNASSLSLLCQENKQYRPKMPYEPHQRILLVGEGNFSFSHALAQLMTHGENIMATCLDDEETVHAKYPDAREHIQALIEMGATVLYGIDATCLHTYKPLKKRVFDVICFNFPHVGAGIKDKHRNIIANQTLIQDFFMSATAKLVYSPQQNQFGEIHLTVKTASPYDEWDIKKLAKSTDQLVTKTSFRFHPELYPGYAHRRSLGFKQGVSTEDNQEILKSHPRTFIFIHKEYKPLVKPIEQNEADDIEEE